MSQSAASPRPTVAGLQRKLRALADPARAAQSQGYFRTGPGEYGEGDQFLGIRVPAVRLLVREFRLLPWDEATVLLLSPWHEDRLTALLLWVQAHRRAEPEVQSAIHHAYLENTRWVNNWDLVDSSAEFLVGPHLPRGGGPLLTRLARSESLWERRIAMLATFHGIRRGDYDATLRMARLLRDDPHDLIHKAVGWLLREMGKRDEAVERAYLDEESARMPRTMLRYAVERFPEPLRQHYLGLRAER